MKKYLSSLLVLTLFLSNFSALAMQRRIENSQENNTVKKFDELPDDVIFFALVPFLDGKTLTNMRIANKKYKKKLDEFIIFIYLKDFKKGFIAKQLAYNVLNFAKIRHLKNELQDKIQKHESTKLCINNSNFKFLDSNNLGEELYNEFSYTSKLSQIQTMFIGISLTCAEAFAFGKINNYILNGILKKIGIKKLSLTPIEIISASKNSSRTRKIISTATNYAVPTLIITVISTGIIFLCRRINVQNYIPNNPIVVNIINRAKYTAIPCAVLSGVKCAIKDDPFSTISKEILKGAVIGIFIGTYTGTYDHIIFPRLMNFNMTRLNGLQNAIRTRHANDMNTLQEISGVENRN